MAHLDPEEFQAVTELKYETLQTTSLHQFTDRLNGLKLKKEQTNINKPFFSLQGDRGFPGSPGLPGLEGRIVSIALSHFKFASILSCTHSQKY